MTLWMRGLVCAIAATALPAFSVAYAADSLNAYGRGGPSSAMREAARMVPIEARYAIYGDAGVALTQRGGARLAAKAFIEFLRSPAGAAIFRRWGWKA